LSVFGDTVIGQWPVLNSMFGEDVVYTHATTSSTITAIVDETQDDVTEAQSYETRLRRARITVLAADTPSVSTERDTVVMRGKTWLVVNMRDVAEGAVRQLDLEVRDTLTIAPKGIR
jgi:hypothetical protein